MQKQFSFLPKLAALSVMAAFAAPAMAQTAGSNVVNLGWFHLAPQDSSGGLTKLNGPGAASYPNRTSSVSNADTVGIAFTHFFTDNFALTADLGIPPEFKLKGTGDLQALGELGKAKQWSPAIVAKYYFGAANDTFRPFVGAGVTYVWYSDVSLSRNFQNSASLNTGGTASASLSSSWSPVLTGGATYAFNDRWSASLSVSYIPLKTDADITAQPAGAAAALGPQRYKTTITLDPIVTFLSVGYKF
ncbi:OmpW family protein [Herbaspirillum sp. BH-1]|uniref:Outer membrane protein n=1 Tax=Herbaspirillum frisingense TaxID=92645 RepID=A0ABU1PGG7_9BURK|nr:MULTISPECIES: OmpW family outer membrane protein [Herbaspirillum]MDR6585038.1 outer membrane protein [Herbaspirillum frisingense]PLY60893.1 OmpW family protein [Herbaspirillum sp. BH-1]QNB05955.1 OmpW family protein [Herbaspirillum frisingense]